ncbi:MAG: penicillin-binding transpeptidase domain-containing protein [Candidatus Dormibacteria bacterium]
MRRGPFGVALLLLAVLGGCGPAPAAAPGPDATVRRFLADWAKGGDPAFEDMYSRLSPAAAATTRAADFVARYQGVDDRMSLMRLDATVGTPGESAGTGTVPAHVRFQSRYAGTFSRDYVFKLSRSGQDWKIDWGPQDILPELVGDRHLREEHQVSARGRITTRDGVELAVTSEQGLSVGVVRKEIKDEPAMLAALASMLGRKAADIQQAYQPGQPDWFNPVATLPPDTPPDIHNRLAAIAGVFVRLAPVRFYPQRKAAAQLVGYVSRDGVAQAGLEKSLDAVLAGTPGGRIYVVDAQETETATVAHRDAVAGKDVVLTVAWPVQQAAESALSTNPRDAVVAEVPRSGDILAIASRPSFDPNDFSFARADAIAAYNADQASPLVLRATSGLYPAGSTFKPITAAAGLKAGVVQPSDQLPCPHLWTGYGPPGQANHESDDLGPINLRTAMARSCNTYFYELAKRLYDRNRSLLPDMARSFGLGRSAGMQLVPDQAGRVPDLPSGIDATNLAIGQGGLQVTPLQMAGYTSALTQGGTVPRPRVVLRSQAADGGSARPYPAAAASHAAARPEDLPVILDAMRAVVADPSGTLIAAFRGSPVQFFGKSGTAETTSGSPDIWFIGGAPQQGATVVVAAMVEEKPNGLHSLDAANIGRSVVEAALKLSPS